MSARQLAKLYIAEGKMGLQQQLQYRTAVFFSILGFLIEPIVYLVVWRTVAGNGVVGGYDANDFVAYYIVWTLVRNMNLALTPYEWDWWIQRGRISDRLIEPASLFHRTMANFGGMKFTWILAWFPIAGFMVLVFRPSVSPSWFEGIAFFVAIWGGYVVRFAILYWMGLISFWTTRASALFEIIVSVELILSGRLVPLSVMPAAVESVGGWLPFKWTFQFPIEVLIGKLSTEEIIYGLGAQLFWFAILGAGISLTWKRATRRYTAVGS